MREGQAGRVPARDAEGRPDLGSQRLGRGRRLRRGRARGRPRPLRLRRAALGGRGPHASLRARAEPRRRDRALVPAQLRRAARARDQGGGGAGRGRRGRGARSAGDLEELAALSPLISDVQSAAPVFSGVEWNEDPDELRASLLADVANDELGELVFERDGRVVAAFELAPVELGSAHRGLAQPDRAALLGWAATAPEARGTGAGVALTEASLAWAHERGYACMVTDWRETNLLSSRFWPARGFRRSFVRLYRSIP